MDEQPHFGPVPPPSATEPPPPSFGPPPPPPPFAPPPFAPPARPPLPPPPPPRDRLAVALGNASLLGIGYLLLRRWGFAVLSWLVTFVLLILLASAARTVWFEIVILVWWALMIVHGWWLSGRPARPTRTGRQRLASALSQRVLAAGLVVVVLAAFGLLRFDAVRIDHSVLEAREHGSCTQAVRALDRIWFGDRLGDAPLTATDDQTGQACQRLHTAEGKLSTALADGDTDALKAGFDDLAWVLTERPGHEKMVDSVLDSFLAGLPTKDACHTAAVTDWLRARKPTHDTLDRAAKVVPRTAPAALVGCGDHYMNAGEWSKAKTRYQQLLDQYPDSDQASAARTGVHQATLGIERDRVGNLLDTPGGDGQPQYCSTPGSYEAAPAYRHGHVNPAMFYGNDNYSNKLPSSWRTDDVTKAALVVCLGQRSRGAAVRTCPYDYLGSTTNVTFHKVDIPMKAFSMRTGKLVAKRTLHISGSSCPSTLSYSYYYADTGPPSDVYVSVSKSDARAAFSSVIAP
jgi:hypothetical protein